MKDPVRMTNAFSHAEIYAPPQKSEAIRLLLLNALSGVSPLSDLPNGSYCDDILRAVECAGLLAKSDTDGAVFDCGESATLLNLLLPTLGVLGRNAVLVLSPRLAERMISPYLDLLSSHGMTFSFLPDSRLQVGGRLSGNDYEVDVSRSSQPLSGLLLALCASAKGKITVRTSGIPVSAPYVRLTERLLVRAGADLTSDTSADGLIYTVSPSALRPLPFDPDGDFSSAVYPLLCGLRRPVRVSGLRDVYGQADSALLPLLRSLDVSVIEEENAVTVCPPSRFSPPAFRFDGRDCPDLLLPLAVLAAFAEGNSILSGFDRLRGKECDRFLAARELLGQMKIACTFTEDTLTVTGGTPSVPRFFDLPADHRVVMSAYLASFLAQEKTSVAHPGCVSKSYPRFFDDMTVLGLPR